jgi:hypothetical protein
MPPAAALASGPVDPATAKLHLSIASAFKVFDHEQNNTIDVRCVVVIQPMNVCVCGGALP